MARNVASTVGTGSEMQEASASLQRISLEARSVSELTAYGYRHGSFYQRAKLGFYEHGSTMVCWSESGIIQCSDIPTVLRLL